MRINPDKTFLRIARIVFNIILYISSFVFWFLLVYCLSYMCYEFISDRPENIISIDNNYSILSGPINRTRITDRKGHETVRSIKTVCVENHYIHGEKNSTPGSEEYFFIIDTDSDDVFLTIKYDSYENSLAEYLHYLKKYGLHECDSSNTVFPLNN